MLNMFVNIGIIDRYDRIDSFIWASFDEFVFATKRVARDDIIIDDDRLIINPVIMLKGVTVMFRDLNEMKYLVDIIRVIRTDRNSIMDAAALAMKFARYFPSISSFCDIGKLRIVSRVPLSFSVTVVDTAIDWDVDIIPANISINRVE